MSPALAAGLFIAVMITTESTEDTENTEKKRRGCIQVRVMLG